MAINVYGQLPGEPEVLLATVERAAEAKAIKDEYAEVFKKEEIKLRVAINK